MTSITITEFETRLHWQGERGALLTSDRTPGVPLACSQAPGHEGRWDPEALLVAAVEGRTLVTFLERARAEGVEVLFYQSSAVGRRVGASEGHITDLIVRPHVAVPTEADAERARRIFEQLPACCFPSSVLTLTPRIEPIIEAWNLGAHRERRHGSLGPDSPPSP